jgi:hypothetical protein
MNSSQKTKSADRPQFLVKFHLMIQAFDASFVQGKRSTGQKKHRAKEAQGKRSTGQKNHLACSPLTAEADVRHSSGWESGGRCTPSQMTHLFTIGSPARA